MGSCHVPIWRVYHSKTKPLMNPILSGALLPNPNQHSKSLTFAQGPMERAPEAMRCEQAVLFAIFHFSTCPLGVKQAQAQVIMVSLGNLNVHVMK